MPTPTFVRATAAIAVAATLLVPSSAVALEQDSPRGLDAKTASAAERDTPGGLDAKTSAAVDARLVARKHGWELEPTMQYLAESRRFVALAAELAKDHPNSFASATFAERPGTVSLVRFVGQAPDDAAARVERSGLRAKVVGGARYSETELQERAKAVHSHLAESGFKQVATATTPDDRVVATVFGRGSTKLPDDLAAGVVVSQSRGPAVRDEHTLGGGPLLLGGGFRCTSGFTVANSRGTTGVATAGHCSVNRYRQPTDGLTYGLTHQGEHNGFFGDYEWKTTSHIEPAQFFATATEVRQVNSVSGWLPVNTPSCVYGRSSNSRACDQVYSNFVIVTVGGKTNWFLMAMKNDNTIPGDSGGPWSFATIADGIHKGDVTLGGGRRNMWSRADLLPLALGVSVRTQ